MLLGRTPFIGFLFTIVAGAMILSSAPAEAATFNIINDGSHTIVSIWVSTPQDNSWGDDLLDGTLEPGYHLPVELAGCYADLKLLYDDGQVVERHNFDICKFDYKSTY